MPRSATLPSQARAWLALCRNDRRQAVQIVMAGVKQGSTEAKAMLGQMLLEGDGIEKDQPLALHWFRMAAQEGHLQAMNMVGRCLENGWGAEVDFTAAAQSYRQAAERGLDWGQYNYANLLAAGRGVEPDLTHAYRLYHMAARQGHAKSMNLVGRFLEEGWLGITDTQEAESWYLRSAQIGDFRGQCSYASCLARQGRVDEAAHWLKTAIHTATPGFLKKMAEILEQSDFPVLRQVANEMRVAAV